MTLNTLLLALQQDNVDYKNYKWNYRNYSHVKNYFCIMYKSDYETMYFKLKAKEDIEGEKIIIKTFKIDYILKTIEIEYI